MVKIMEMIKKLNVLNDLILRDAIKEMDKGEKKYLLEITSKYTIDDNGEVKTNANGVDIQVIKNYLNKYCIVDSAVFDSVSNNEFKKVLKIALTECFKLKVARVDKTSELNSYTIEIANNSILAFTKSLLKAFLNHNYMTIVEIDGNYRIIDIDKFREIKMQAHKQMWEKIKIDCGL